MYGEHHDLRHDLPEHADAIHELKIADQHFARLFEEYHLVDREIRRVEQQIEARGDTAMEDLKKQRILLKDELLAMIRIHESSELAE
ncbi:YdcH family protein [Pelagibius sp. Alg239-R121]|uniref:YdcH family protein n=1 Tax=Pelagibius sp. Alg239-R121 TaxID=2993448 RepID=UPI0024A6684C|nr:YdcH family protein [Pelagibius sp. Alg239-R121]